MSEDFWKKMEDEFEETVKKRREKRRQEAQIKKQKAEKERYYKEAEEYQQNVNQIYSGNGQGSGNGFSDNDASSLYNKFTADGGNHYKDEIANHYGKHFNGYTEIDMQFKLNRGMGMAPNRSSHIKDKLNTHRFDSLAPRIRIHLDNDWTKPTETNNQPERTIGGGNNRSFNGGRNNGGVSLKGRF